MMAAGEQRTALENFTHIATMLMTKESGTNDEMHKAWINECPMVHGHRIYT